jgi:hypothetical protein
MFNLYYRPFSPGFRVRPQQEVPGFDIIDENSAVPSASRGRTSAPALEADLHENVRRAPSQLTDFAFPVAAGSDLGPRPFEAISHHLLITALIRRSKSGPVPILTPPGKNATRAAPSRP